ncbi:MAG TPA: glycine cleavage system protein GcvH [Burkholderiales bacterium]|nr:glycine cleavage system protein GcvH [Burkholderiales bacterium]
MSIPADLKYTKSHEWVRLEADGVITVGITDHAQELLGDMVFVETPEIGRELNANEECAVVESVKAASDVYAPVAGTVVAANDQVTNSPEKINADAYANWMFKIKPKNAGDLNSLLDAAGYQAIVDAE